MRRGTPLLVPALATFLAVALAVAGLVAACDSARPGADPPARAAGTAAVSRGAGVVAEPVRATAGVDQTLAGGFRRAEGSRVWSFPRDHAAHPAYATEWWYTTGILRASGGRRFGYELTFFRRGLVPPEVFRRGLVPSEGEASGRLAADGADADGLGAVRSPWRARDLILAHAAITDVTGRRFVVEERLERAAHGWAGADTLVMNVWAGDWRAAAVDGGFSLRVPPASTGGRLGLDLRLRSDRPPVLHGAGGLSAKDAGPRPHASWYASLPRLETEGRLTVDGEAFEVSGMTWMDHEFFSGGLAEGQVGWDWFSARLEDGRDLMLLRMRDEAGETDYVAGTVTSPDGSEWRPVRTGGAAFESLATWTSRSSGIEYPIAWRIRLPREGLELRTRTPLTGQEVETERAGAFTYWEGLVDYEGTWDGAPVRGEGYVELTGYGAPLDLR